MAVASVRVTPVDGGVTTPRGFRAAGTHCGIKSQAPDLALVVSDGPAAAAGMFTQIATRAAPVVLNEAKLRAGRAQAVVINSGNANACVGARGFDDARAMTSAVAGALGIADALVLGTSTGVIGRPLPIDRITAGVPALVAALGPDGDPAARAIMTTDAFPKTAAVRVDLGDGPLTIGGMAKGAGMIHPDMATMIAVLATDATIDPATLRGALRAAVDRTFNCISVDGDTSTSDSVFVLANGAAGLAPVAAGGERYEAFVAGLTDIAERLAKMIVRDGEGATRLVEVRVRGARADAEARAVGRTVMTSLLVKTMFHGAELNWGRVTAAVGRSGAQVDPDRIAVAIGDVWVVRDGVGLAERYGQAEPLLREAEVCVTIDLGLGAGTFTGWTSDLGESYVRINSGYLT
jgi:glutamate N-acetyltransferase/amino-acid N-acetyltransferase